MKTLLIFIVLSVGLFLLAYLTKRRFGLLALGLCAGAVLSTNLTSLLEPWVESRFTLPLSLGALITLLPAVLFCFGGVAYSSHKGRIIGSLIFTVIALAFVLPALSGLAATGGIGAAIYNGLQQWQGWIVSGGILLAIFDIFAAGHHAKSRTSH